MLPLAQALDFVADRAGAGADRRGGARAEAAPDPLCRACRAASRRRRDSRFGGLGAISWSAHALVAEARLLAPPVSFELATTTPEEGIADRITMAPLAARRLAEQVGLGRRIVAVSLLCAAQALGLRAPAPAGRHQRCGRGRRVRELVPFAGRASPYPSDLEPLTFQPRRHRGALGDAAPMTAVEPRPLRNPVAASIRF